MLCHIVPKHQTVQANASSHLWHQEQLVYVHSQCMPCRQVSGAAGPHMANSRAAGCADCGHRAGVGELLVLHAQRCHRRAHLAGLHLE